MKNLRGRPSLKEEFTGEADHYTRHHPQTCGITQIKKDINVTAQPSRWLFARPRGGLNDVLCQVERCWRFAEKTGRELVFDTRDSGLLLDFHDVFTVREDVNSVIPHTLTPELVTYLNTLSAFPKDTEGNVDGYSSYKDDNDEFHTLPSRSPLKFSLKRDFAEDVVVYEGMGGGVASFCALQRLELAPWLAKHVSDSLASLPTEYISIHVRQSDLTTNYQKFLAKVNTLIGPDTRVFIASDSDEVQEFATTIFPPPRLNTLPSYDSRKGVPLHAPEISISLEHRRRRTAEMFAELFALACAERFFFTDIAGKSAVSGFSRLAAHLVSSSTRRNTLLSHHEAQFSSPPGRAHHVAPVSRRIAERTRMRFRECAQARS